MATHLLRDLESLKKEILLVGSMVEDATHKALLSLTESRIELTDEVIEGDKIIDQKEIEVEEDCLKILALHQPVAADLRYVVAVMKVNNDLERCGDLAGNIASRAKFLLSSTIPVHVPEEIHEMGSKVMVMLRESLEAMVHLDTHLAHKVLQDDDDIDERHRQLYQLLHQRMKAEPSRIEYEMNLLSVSRYLERIADLATNIAEDVVFTVDGDVVRHRSW